MGFQHIDLNSQQLMNSARSDCESIRNFCAHLLGALDKFFAQNQAQVHFGATFKREGDLLCSLETLYGKARGRLTIQLVEGVMAGRYVFEKSVVSADGQDAWIPVWAIRIGRNGNVWLGDEGEKEIDVVNLGPQNLSIGVAARSLLYCVAVTPIFK
jgi:hypothetical protein